MHYFNAYPIKIAPATAVNFFLNYFNATVGRKSLRQAFKSNMQTDGNISFQTEKFTLN